jgi:hypothetical protein
MWWCYSEIPSKVQLHADRVQKDGITAPSTLDAPAAPNQHQVRAGRSALNLLVPQHQYLARGAPIRYQVNAQTGTYFNGTSQTVIHLGFLLTLQAVSANNHPLRRFMALGLGMQSVEAARHSRSNRW